MPTMPIHMRWCKLSSPKLRDGNTYDLKGIGHGVSGMVLSLDDRRVIKTPIGSQRSFTDIETEREAYRLLAKRPSPYVVKCYNYNDPNGIILEKLTESVRSRLQEEDIVPTEDEILRWVMQAARGVAFIHSREIVQADVGCHNMLLDSKGNLKLCDFSGCSIKGKRSSVRYEIRSQLPSIELPHQQADIFALGSAIYEISVGRAPYHDKSDYEVMMLYQNFQFSDDYPADKDQLLWTVIKRCWEGGYNTADDVVKAIAEHPQLSRKSSRSWKYFPVTSIMSQFTSSLHSGSVSP